MGEVNRDLFNNASIQRRSAFVTKYGKFVEHIMDGDYHYHLFFVRDEFIQVVYEVCSQQIVDIWMLDYEDLAEFTNIVDICDLYVRKPK